MSTQYKYLEVTFSTNMSGDFQTMEKLYNSMNDTTEGNLIMKYDNGAKFLIKEYSYDAVMSIITGLGFSVISNGDIKEAGTLIAIITKTSSRSFKDLDSERISALWK